MSPRAMVTGALRYIAYHTDRFTIWENTKCHDEQNLKLCGSACFA